MQTSDTPSILRQIFHMPDFSRENPNCQAHVVAEWSAFNAGRAFEVVPRGAQPSHDRPNGITNPDDEDYFGPPADGPPSRCDGSCSTIARLGQSQWDGRGFCRFCGEDGNA